MTQSSVLTRGIALLQDALFPRFCVGCKREGKILCMACDEAWSPRSPLIFKEGQGVVETSEVRSEGWSFGAYADPVLRGLLTTWKYHFDHTAWEVLRRRLQSQMSLMHLRAAIAGVDAVVPVPLSRHRRAERGFDQAAEIAQWIAVGIHRPILHVLQRKHTDGRQAERTIEERKAAMSENPFVARLPLLSKEGPGVVAPPKHVLLVDDVWTTGATMHAAAAALESQGIASHFLTIAAG